MTKIKPPVVCETKQDVRTEIDRIDKALVAIFAERHSYVSRMAELKSDPHEAFDAERIDQMIVKIKSEASAMQLDEDQAELIWRTLIDWNINYEKGIIAARCKL